MSSPTDSQAAAADQRLDLAVAVGVLLALVWVLYVDPLTGELLGLALGSLPVVAATYRYVDPGEYVVQGLAGLSAVALGGAAPATVLYRTPAGDWLVGSQPLPLALGIALLVTLLVVVGRRRARAAVARSGGQTA